MDESGILPREFRAAAVDLVVIRKRFGDFLQPFPRAAGVPGLHHLVSGNNHPFHFGDFLQHPFQLLLILRFPQHSPGIFGLLPEDLPVVFLGDQGVEIVEHPAVHVAISSDLGGEGLEVWVGRPDQGGLGDVFGHALVVFGNGGAARFLDMQAAGTAGGFDGGAGFRIIKILGRLAQAFHQFLGEGIILDVDGGNQLVGIPDKPLDLLPFLPFKGADPRQVFAHDEGLAEALAGAFQFIALDQIDKSLHALIDIADGLAGHRIQGRDGGGDPGALHKQLFNIRPFLQFQPGVTVFKQSPVEPGSDDAVFEAALQEKLHDQGLELHLGFQLRGAHLRRIGNPDGVDFHHVLDAGAGGGKLVDLLRHGRSGGSTILRFGGRGLGGGGATFDLEIPSLVFPLLGEGLVHFPQQFGVLFV